MATYYVSATDGNDSDDGSTAALAFATIGAGENAADTAGDIVYIAPGNYREKVVHGTSGTEANRIYFIGDPDCEHFPDVTSGIVRVTHAVDTNELAIDGSGATNGPVIKTNGRDYLTWKNVHVDGGSGGLSAYNDSNSSYGFYSNSEADELEVINCLAQSVLYGFFNVKHGYNCAAIGCQQYGFYRGGNFENCISFMSYYGFYQVDLAKNCISIGGQTGFYTCDKAINCFSNAGSGYRLTNGDFVYDSIAVGCQYPFYAGSSTNPSANGTISGSYGTGNYYLTYYGKIHGIGFGTTRNQWLNGRDPIMGMGGSTDMQGDGTIWPQKGMTLWSINDARKIMDACKPSVFSKAIQGCTITDQDDDAGPRDILGNPRKMGSLRGMFNEGSNTTSSRDIGPFELSNIQVTGSYSGSMPAFKIEDEGIFIIPISVSGSSSVTASVNIKHQSGSGLGVKPQFILRYTETSATASAKSANTTTAANEYLTGSNLYIQTVTSTANNDIWENISVSGSFTKNKEVELLFRNQQTGSDAISSFSYVEIQ